MRHRKLAPSKLIAVALGGNVGSRDAIEKRFRAAIRLLRAAGAFNLAASHVYESTPSGPVADQPRFLNAVVGFQLSASHRPARFLTALWSIERALGRVRPTRPRRGPRTLDLDLLLWRLQRSSKAALTIPHPRMAARPFVTRPLSEITDGALPIDDADCRRIAPPSTLISH